jgi:hypothetical protein
MAFPEEKGVPPHARPSPRWRSRMLSRRCPAQSIRGLRHGRRADPHGSGTGVWKRMFDEFLPSRRTGRNACRAYEHPADYLAHIDAGRATRVLTLPALPRDQPASGSPDDAPCFGTVWALAIARTTFSTNRPQPRRRGRRVDLSLIHALRPKRPRGPGQIEPQRALVLARAQGRLFEVVVDGLVAVRSGRERGKPAAGHLPVRQFATRPSLRRRAIVVEDAFSPAPARRTRRICATWGVARGQCPRTAENRADIVVADLAGSRPHTHRSAGPPLEFTPFP